MDAATYKLVALLNKKLDPGRVLNALGHMAVGLAASLDDDERRQLNLLTFVDADGNAHAPISALSFIVLAGTSANIRTLRERAVAAGLRHVPFISTMVSGTYAEQLERTKAIREAELTYFGILLFGPRNEIDGLTRKYSLYR